MKIQSFTITAMGALLFGMNGAEAGKKNGTINIALQEPHASIDEIQQPSAEIQVMAR